MDLTFFCQNFSLFSPWSVVFIHLYFSQRLSCVPLLSMPTSPRRCGFVGLMRVGCFSRCCVCDAVTSLPEPASHHQPGAGWGLLSWSPLAFCYQLERLSDELQNGSFLRGEPEQSSAGELCAWPGLLMQDNKQTQQFSWVSHAYRDRRDVNHAGRTLNLLLIIIHDECVLVQCVLCFGCVWNAVQN